jgi:CBS domain-containing protein
MAKARDVMTPDARCIGENETLADAAKLMAQLDVGALPICGQDDRLKGMLTDRDIVVKALAQGREAGTTRAGQLAQGKPVTIGADDLLDEALRTMADHRVRRLPVIDGHRLVGIVALKDLVQALPDPKAGDLVQFITEG